MDVYVKSMLIMRMANVHESDTFINCLPKIMPRDSK